MVPVIRSLTAVADRGGVARAPAPGRRPAVGAGHRISVAAHRSRPVRLARSAARIQTVVVASCPARSRVTTPPRSAPTTSAAPARPIPSVRATRSARKGSASRGAAPAPRATTPAARLSPATAIPTASASQPGPATPGMRGITRQGAAFSGRVRPMPTARTSGPARSVRRSSIVAEGSVRSHSQVVGNRQRTNATLPADNRHYAHHFVVRRHLAARPLDDE